MQVHRGGQLRVATKMIAVSMWMVRSGLCCYCCAMRGLLLSIFPATVLGLATLDRALTYALPAHAASPTYWGTWFNVRELVSFYPHVAGFALESPISQSAVLASLFLLLVLQRERRFGLVLANGTALCLVLTSVAFSGAISPLAVGMVAVGAAASLVSIHHFVRRPRATKIYGNISARTALHDS